jgi:AraC family transcriptional regulator
MKPGTRLFYELAVERSVEHIARHLDEALDLERLARLAALSPFHFHRVFRGMLGETPLELLRRLRLERAAWRLLSSEDSITGLAFDAGFETHEAFSRAFRARFGASPSEFRQRAEGARAGCQPPPVCEIAAQCGVHVRPNGAISAVVFRRGDSVMNVEIKSMPAVRVGAVRHIGPYHSISNAFAKLGALAAPAGLFVPEAMMIALYHDETDTTPQDQLRSDAALSVSASAVLPEGLTEHTLPAGKYAMAVHKGPYQELGDAWGRLMGEWLPKSGHRVGEGVCYEVYRNNPGQVPPAELLTELYVPLA